MRPVRLLTTGCLLLLLIVGSARGQVVAAEGLPAQPSEETVPPAVTTAGTPADQAQEHDATPEPAAGPATGQAGSAEGAAEVQGAAEVLGAAEDEAAQKAAAQDEPAQDEPAQDEARDPDPCAPYRLPNNQWIDRLHKRVFRSVCGSAIWFDRFFGEERLYEEAEETHGRVLLRMLWDEYDHLDYRARFRVHVNLPNLNNRWHAFLARINDDEFVSDSAEDENRAIMSARDDEDDHWLVGFGYYPLNARRQRFRISVGANLGFPIEPYVKAQYRYYNALGDDAMFRFRQTVFWRREARFGTTTNLDLEHRIGTRFLLRWANSGTLSETTDGVSWWTGLTLYQDLLKDRALAYKVWWQGESDAPVTVEEFGLRVIFRKSVWREWLFGEVGAGISWPKTEIWEHRDKSWGVLVGFEMYFGNLF